jgi:hypothetical protein
MSTRVFGPPPTNLNRSYSTRNRASVAEEDFDLEDSDAQSQYESLFTNANLSPTVSGTFELESPKQIPKLLKQQSSFETATSPLVDTGAVSVTVTGSKIITQKSIPPPLTTGSFSLQTPSQSTTMQAIQQMRDMMNNRFDQLIAQITRTATDVDTQSTTRPIENEPQKRSQTPSSAPPRSTLASPKKIAFTLTGPTNIP